ncbi:response regulator [Solihabitans fulvus]|uniref:Transcriptional regulatory protein n=1 Tax=Solihabitans fulvus TaxID=1892852 RepID=A0A5B2WPW4_9PSEU|nr:response regulator [Solihabitans fulvus]KAA2252566.1 response regulator [Solihabitans fulvus]
MIRTLVVDDDYRVAGIHAAYVNRVGEFTVVGEAHNAAEAAAAIGRLRPDLVLLDLYLPDGHGLDVVRAVAEEAMPHPDFIVITAARDVQSVRKAMQLGAVHYLVKPFGFGKLQDRLVAYRDLRRRLHQLGEASQDDVDALYATMRTPPSATLPKRHSAPTMALVRDAVQRAAADVSAAEVAALVGVSRPTAQRYLSYLTQQGVVELSLRYGGQGRPEQRYRTSH